MKIKSKINKRIGLLHNQNWCTCLESPYLFNKNRKLDMSHLTSPELNDKRLREYVLKLDIIKIRK